MATPKPRFAAITPPRRPVPAKPSARTPAKPAPAKKHGC
jgi:hypothetical protein